MAPINSSAVQRLRKAGGIVLGSSNMDEMGMGSWGKYGYGRTHVKNPIDEAHFAGGSSAGSAAAVKSYQTLSAIGTDTGGSVNYPAHCCGLVSLKPSYGRISRFGQLLYSSSNETTGPMGHSVADVHALFNIMEGPDQHDSHCIDFTKFGKIRDLSRINQKHLDSPDILKGVKVGVVDEFNITELDDRNRNI
jgi:aspartyl-tRNA(Asn)/glutamyl-tRNA(Gln) amidotransferase subunit A